MCILAQAFTKNLAFSYFDVFVVLWLLLGLFMGRKHGMSQELLPTLQWVCIVIVAGLFYQPIAAFIRQNTAFDMLFASIFAYVFLGFAVHFVFLWIKKALGDKLVGSDMFGRGEYYLGMAAGTVRFACMVVCLIALLNARVYSQQELAQIDKFQKQNFEDVRLPDYPHVQHNILFDSISGRTIKGSLGNFLIASVGPQSAAPKADSLAKKQEQQINEILNGKK